MRGMGTDASAQTLMDGQRLVYNYIRPHMALGGQTPAEAAGIDLGLKGNRVEMLIEKSYAARNTERTGGSNLG